MKRIYNLKQKIIFYIMAVSIFLAVCITIIMSAGSIHSTDSILLDNMQMTAQIASQSISSNLHLQTERIYNLAQNPVLANFSSYNQGKEDFLNQEKLQIEFVWLSVYDTSGNQLYGDTASPSSLAGTPLFASLTETGNTAIGEPFFENEIPQFCVGSPIRQDGEIKGFLVGSYKYDLLNDVLSMLVLGDTGSAFILNENGQIISDQSFEYMKNNTSIYDLYASAKNAAAYDKILAYQTGSARMSLHGTNHYVGYTPISGTNWVLLIDAPRIEFMDSVILSLVFTVSLAILLLLIAAAAIIPIAKRISASLSTTTSRLQALAEGDLTEEVILSDSIEETKLLTEALAKTIARLKSYIQDIHDSLGSLSGGDYTITIPDNFCGDFSSIRDSLCTITDALNQTMVKLSQSSIEASSNSGEVSDYAKQLHNGSVEQAELLENLKESMANITKALEKNTDNVLQIEQYSNEAEEKTALGDHYMQSMLETMKQIHSAVDEISNISQLIEDISSQTNLLSLNASIEAARAGEAGRGFAIVAAEIGQLSSQTTNALKQTGDIIQNSADIIEEGLKIANQTAEAFQEIREVTKAYLTISAQLSDTVQEQTAIVDSVTDQILSLNGIAEDNKYLSEETEQMALASLTQSESLRDYVAQVKIRESN